MDFENYLALILHEIRWALEHEINYNSICKALRIFFNLGYFVPNLLGFESLQKIAEGN